MPAEKATHFRFQDLPQDSPIPLLRRRRIIGEKAMLSELELDKGCDAPLHQHENEQFIVLLSGKLRVTLGDAHGGEEREVVLQGGDVMVIPPNVPHGAYAVEDCRLIDIFSPPSGTTGIDQS